MLTHRNVCMLTVAVLFTLLPQAGGVSYNAVPLPTAVLLGNTATLLCSFRDLSPDDVVSWARSSGRVISSGRRVDPKYPRYQVVGDLEKGEFHLRLQDARLEDEGAYTCNIFGLIPREAKLTIVVPVPQPPALRGAEVPGQAGQQLELSCTSSGGNPPPQLTWYNGTEVFTGQHANLEKRGGQVELDLILRRLTKWDNGMNLTCRASQPFPEITSAQEAWTVLRVHYPPSASIPTPSVRVMEGDSADLRCLVDSNPPASISWTRPGHPPLINPSTDDKVTALQDDNDFSLNCLVEGNPKPKVTWRRKNTKLYWENPLRFHRVRYDVEGTYQCVATSGGFPQEAKDIFIDVVGKPYMEGEGDTTMISSDNGETVRLGCTVTADPLPSRVEWIWRNNYELETELDNDDVRIVTTRRNQEMASSLTITNVAVNDGGIYICKTTNMFGTAKRNIHLEIKESVPKLVIVISISAGVVLVATVAVVILFIAKRKGWICKSHLDESFDLSATRPMPPVPKYVYKTGTIDSGVEDLQELQEMYGTLKPRPPPRMEKKWESVGLSYSAWGVTFNDVPVPIAALLGHTATLRCSFRGLSVDDVVIWNGPPDMTAITSGRRVNPNYPRHKVVGDRQEGEFHLQIRDIRLDDEGAYKCNIFGLSSRGAKLTVIVPVPQPPTLRGAEVPGQAGQQLELSCTSSGGNPPPQLTWYNGTEAFPERYMRQQQRGDRVEVELVLRRLTKGDNGMNLTCRASQPFPKITSAQDSWTVLRVNYPPSIAVPTTSVRVKEGDPAVLSCLVDSNPFASITWTKSGRPIPDGDIGKGTFRIPSASRQDAGIYQCTADNGVLPIATKTVSLDVLYAPWIDQSMEKKITIQQGNDEFSLECQANGNPEPRVKWWRKDTNLYWENPLRFQRVNYDIEGTYQCVAISNGFPQSTKDVHIDVIGKPYLDGQGNSAITIAAVGEAVRIDCAVTADPLPSNLEWIWRNKYGMETELDSTIAHIVTTRRNQKITSTLTIPDVAVKDSGDYVCKATNMFGSVMRNIHLDIEESIPNVIVIASIAAGAILVATVAAVLVIIAKRKGWICKSNLDDPMELPGSRPMPPVPKYVYKTGTIDSGVEDLQELQEMYGTLKPRPPPRMEKKWESVGLSYSAWSVSYNEVPEPTAALLGHSVTLRCSVHDMSPDDVVVWSGPPDMAAITSGRRVDPSYPRHQVVGDVQKGEFYLHIRDVRLEDGGDYRCKNFGLSPKEATLTVIAPVSKPPTLRGAEVPGQAGQQLKLSCTSSGGNPPPQLTWYNGTEAFPERYMRQQQRGDRVEVELVLRRLTKGDNGMNLTCRASQPFPEITSAQDSWTVLQVNYPPLIDPAMEKKVTVQQGNDEFTLECLVDGNPTPRVKWWRKDTNLYWENPLRFHRVHYDIEGTYQCVAISNGFPQSTKNVCIDVIGKPYLDGQENSAMTTAGVGETVRLDCAVTADPLPSNVEWIWRNKYGMETELDSTIAQIDTTRRNQKMTSTLTIPDAAVKDSGDYACKTSNMFGSVMRNIHLDIEESIPNVIVITSIAAGAILVATVSAVLVIIAKRKGWICTSHLDDSIELPASRPMPPVPKYVYKTGTIDSGVEDLQEMYGTLKPRPPPRMEKKWESVGLSYSGLVHSTSVPPYSV
ncbi:HMCN2 [Branchiostoma lanceolatum]|uniref:HMCN2 protein n=1 Tax=Branchiostoma lanceolatum TaxID=7740 RepID=A0A8J9WC23_BRALA|nr:HMCN2 [Branchiostoma lanceolatum]